MEKVDEIMKLVAKVVACELDVEGWWGQPSDAVKLEAARAALLAEVRRLTDEAGALRRECDERKAEQAESDAVRERLVDLLIRTAVALSGPEPDLARWSWHDVPDRAAAAIAALGGATQAAAEAMRERDELVSQNAELAARLAEIEQAEPERAEPVAWVPVHPREGALWSMTTATPSEERLPSHYPLSPLYKSPAPAAAPERAEPVQGAVLLTDEQIVELRQTTRPLPGQWGDTKAFARAIERASLKANGMLPT